MCNKTVSVLFVPKLKPIFWYKLYCFYYVSHFKSYSKAANLLRINQSTLSRAVKSLEQRLGCVLLLRNRRGMVAPTLEGHLMMQPIAEILAQLQSIEVMVFK